MLNNKNIIITGGSGSLGNRLVERIMTEYKPNKIVIYSRDEFKQDLMQKKYPQWKETLRYFIGDVADKERLNRAFEGMDIVIHAAAMKQVPTCEYNSIEAVKTNITGAVNIINCAIDKGVKKVIALSTDKSCNPVTLYGCTKAVSDKLFIAGNAYCGGKDTKFSVVRYGNVTGSRGSVVPFFKTLLDKGADSLPITDFRMTRFYITLDQGVDLIFKTIAEAKGGETFVSKIPSYKIIDLARAMSPDVKLYEVGIRESEKLHETMITEEDARTTYDYGDYYIIYPCLEWWDFKKHFKEGGNLVMGGFIYKSDTNSEWLFKDDLQRKLREL